MAVGCVTAIAMHADYELSQAWSRYFYETPSDFPDLDGLMYLSAHNTSPAIALYERCQDPLVCALGDSMRLDGDPQLVAEIRSIAERHNLLVTWR